MKRPAPAALLLAGLAAAGCAGTDRSLYDWGQYEESLYLRARDASGAGQATSLAMLERTIREAEDAGARVPPGVHADYGHLLFRLGRRDEALAQFRREAEAYPESRYFMEAVIARVERGPAR